VDAGVHHLQGKAEFVRTAAAGTLGLLTEFYTEKLASVVQHQAHARLVHHYDANNTYQYVINREEIQLSWLARAIMDEGGSVPESAPARAGAPSGGGEPETALFTDDARSAQAFIERWRPRVEAMEHVRHRNMLRVILGEAREQQRFFEQALAGRTDLLGRRTAAGPALGDVLPTRWIE
jgi:hypothetical protein